MLSRGGWEQGSAAIDAIVGLPGSACRSAMLHAGNAYIEMFEYSSPAGKPAEQDRPVCDHGYTHFCLDVQDIDAEYERLLGLGMRFHCPPAPASDLRGGSGPRMAVTRMATSSSCWRSSTTALPCGCPSGSAGLGGVISRSVVVVKP